MKTFVRLIQRAPTLTASLRSCMFRVLPSGVTAHKKILAASTCTRTSWEQRSKPRTDNGVADSGYLPHAIAKVIRKARKTFAPNCSEVALKSVFFVWQSAARKIIKTDTM